MIHTSRRVGNPSRGQIMTMALAKTGAEDRASTRPRRPSAISGVPPLFDRFAGLCSDHAGRAPFFVACLLLVAIWLPTMAFMSIDTSQLVINTITSIITFLLVALLQNSQSRADSSTQHKLNEIADALAHLIAYLDVDDHKLRRDVEELHASVGLEHRERS